MELSNHKIKTRVFLGEPLRIFHDCFLCVYIFSPVTFTTVFRVFSLLIACFNAANFTMTAILLPFYQVLYFCIDVPRVLLI